MTPARRTLITAAVLLLTLVIFLRYDGSKTLGRTRATLPDGTVLTVETLTFGATHQFTADRSWMGRLRRTLPPPLRRFIAANGPSAMTTTRSNSVVVWLTADHPRPAQQLGGVNQLPTQL